VENGGYHGRLFSWDINKDLGGHVLIERYGAILGKMKIVSSPLKIMKKCYPWKRRHGIETRTLRNFPPLIWISSTTSMQSFL
jgi:hypothetical protein